MGRKSNLEKDLEVQLGGLTEEIRKLSQIGEAVKNSKLKQRVILLLLQDMTKISMRDVQIILEALPNLEETYLQQDKK